MKGNYQTFYKEEIKNKTGYVTKDGTWAAVPTMDSSKKLAIICLLYTSPSPRA